MRPPAQRDTLSPWPVTQAFFLGGGIPKKATQQLQLLARQDPPPHTRGPAPFGKGPSPAGGVGWGGVGWGGVGWGGVAMGLAPA